MHMAKIKLNFSKFKHCLSKGYFFLPQASYYLDSLLEVDKHGLSSPERILFPSLPKSASQNAGKHWFFGINPSGASVALICVTDVGKSKLTLD